VAFAASMPAGADLSDRRKVMICQLADATQALNDTFYLQPPPGADRNAQLPRFRQKIHASPQPAPPLARKGRGLRKHCRVTNR
jgi:hypothetical protein